MAWVHRGTRATNGRSVWNQYMWMCIVWRSFGHCGDIVMLLCTRDGIVDSKTKSVASQLFSYALSYCRRAIRYKMKKRSQSYSIFHFRALPSRFWCSSILPLSFTHTNTYAITIILAWRQHWKKLYSWWFAFFSILPSTNRARCCSIF